MKTAAIDGLLVLGVVLQAGTAVGVLVMRDVYQRLHYAAAATTLGPIAFALAVVLRESLSGPGMKAVLTAIMLLAGGALSVHATGRAAVIRERGGWTIAESEIESPR